MLAGGDCLRLGLGLLPATATQFAVEAPATGVMWANMLRAFQVGKALISHDGPSSLIRESRRASAQRS